MCNATSMRHSLVDVVQSAMLYATQPSGCSTEYNAVCDSPMDVVT